MEITKINTVMRPRSNWQAIDLGFTITREWYLPLVLSYFVFSLPIVLIAMLLLNDYLHFAIVFVWWSKPLWEVSQLNYISLALFGQRLTPKQQWQQWYKVVLKHGITFLLTRRLSLQRSYLTPVLQLENLPSNKFKKRRKLFEGNNQQAAQWLTLTLQQIETALLFGAVILASYLVPEQILESYDPFSHLYEGVHYSIAIGYYIAIALVSPFFTCSGFSLYLNQRSQIEGWDIEIAFRRMVERVQSKSQSTASTALCLLISAGLLTTTLTPIPVSATEIVMSPEQKITKVHYTSKFSTKHLERAAARELQYIEITYPQSKQQQQSQTQILNIIMDPRFNHVSKTVDYQLVEPSKEKKKLEQDDSSGWLFELISSLAASVQWLLTIAVVCLVIIAIMLYRQWYLQSVPNEKRGKRKMAPQPVKQLFGLDLTESSLPDNPAQVAQKLWQQGKARQALSLLYRASLARLIQGQNLQIKDSFTEGECVEQVNNNTNQQTAKYFQTLTRQWQNLAYANIDPNGPIMQQLISQWDQEFALTTNGNEQEQGTR